MNDRSRSNSNCGGPTTEMTDSVAGELRPRKRGEHASANTRHGRWILFLRHSEGDRQATAQSSCADGWGKERIRGKRREHGLSVCAPPREAPESCSEEFPVESDFARGSQRFV